MFVAANVETRAEWVQRRHLIDKSALDGVEMSTLGFE